MLSYFRLKNVFLFTYRPESSYPNLIATLSTNINFINIFVNMRVVFLVIFLFFFTLLIQLDILSALCLMLKTTSFIAQRSILLNSVAFSNIPEFPGSDVVRSKNLAA